MFEKILVFIAFLFPLIFFHELGHFLFAKLFGVRVTTFSIGFGPKILKKIRGETEFALSLIPLGGYVKLFGDDPLKKDEIASEDRKYSFVHKSKWARFWIVFGGPLANFIFTFFLYWGILLHGEKVPEAQLGVVSQDTFYYQQGLRSGDKIVKINDIEILGMTQLPEESMMIDTITVERNTGTFVIPLKINSHKFLEDFFTLLSSRLRKPIVVDAQGQYFALGDKSGVNWNFSFEDFESQTVSEIYLYPITTKELDDQANQYPIDLKAVVKLEKSENTLLQEDLRVKGLYLADLMVRSIVMSSPADKAKIKSGDIIFSIGDKKLVSFEQLRQLVQDAGTKNLTLNFKILRQNQLMDIPLTPDLTKIGKQSVYTVGIFSSGIYQAVSFKETKPKGFFSAIPMAIARTWDSVKKTLVGFKQLITNEVSLKNLGGPLAIGKVASDSLKISFTYFFSLMALISVNLGIINLFPIPVLDGGHILFIILEVFNRGPLSNRKIQIAQQVGVSFLFLLIFVALYNDIARFF